MKNWLKQQSISFVIGQILGYLMTVAGLVVVVVFGSKGLSLTNLKPAIRLLEGLAIAVVGLILVCISFRIRWMNRVEAKLSKLEEASAEQGIPAEPGNSEN